MPEGLPASYRWVSSDKGRHLRGRAKSGTWPERHLRSHLHRRGLRFRIARRIAKGCTPDILFVGARVAVFVDGCFWHGCPRHGPMSVTGPNAELWKAKFARNHRSDERANDLARANGFAVIRVWECEVREDAPRVASEIERTVRFAAYSARKKLTAESTADSPDAVTVEPRDS